MVVLVVSQVVAKLRSAREEAERRTEESERLYELVAGADRRPHAVGAADPHGRHRAIRLRCRAGLRWSCPTGGATELGSATALQVAATAGQPLTEGDVASLTSGGGQARSLGLLDDASPRRVSVALVVQPPAGRHARAPGRAAGGARAQPARHVRQPGRAGRRPGPAERAGPAHPPARGDRPLASARSMGAASHDLRTPLASIKTAVSSMRQVDAQLEPEDRAELLELIELQSDRLARLVTNLLDMTRLEAGALELRPTTVELRATWSTRRWPCSAASSTPGRVVGRRAGGPAPPAPRPRPDEPGPGQRARERRAPVARRTASSGSTAGPRPGSARRWSRSR